MKLLGGSRTLKLGVMNQSPESGPELYTCPARQSSYHHHEYLAYVLSAPSAEHKKKPVKKQPFKSIRKLFHVQRGPLASTRETSELFPFDK